MRVRYQAPLLLLALLAVMPDGGYNQSCSSWSPSEHFLDQAESVIRNVTQKVAAADCALARAVHYPHYDAVEGEQFDYIVVGAGSAGSVVANRLTERRDWTVLLLEAGGDPTKTTEVPQYFVNGLGSSLEWSFQTEQNEYNCLGMVGGRCNWPQGKVLGGSSSINYMLYVRGNAKDYDQWAAAGITGWSYKEVLPYFKKSENMVAKEVTKNSDFRQYHGTGGYLQIESWRDDSSSKPLGGVFAKGFKEIGYDENPDLNGKTQVGFNTFQGTLKDGRRCSTAKSFLRPAANRTNLKIGKHSFVTKILIDENTKTAFGVQFIDKYGKIINVKAKKEVIVSAGALNTPKLLMLSGIGPRRALEEQGIKVIEDLPVGENLQDHNFFIGLVLTLNITRPVESPEDSMFDFLVGRDSRLSSLGGLGSHVGFLNTIEGIDYPDIEITFIEFTVNDPGLAGFLNTFNLTNEIKNEYLKINANRYLIVSPVSLLQPYSRGNVKLNSSNPTDKPKFNGGYFTDYRDIQTYLRAYEIFYKLVRTEALAALDAKVHEIHVPECSRFSYSGNTMRECTLRHLTSPSYHQSGTCKMGNVFLRDTVVDPRLRVKGLDRLRVVDASVMPTVVSGNTNAGTIMIGEKGSDMIKETWNAEST